MKKCAVCTSTKSRFIKELEASEPLTQFGIKTPLSKIPLLCDILLWEYKREIHKLTNFCWQNRSSRGKYIWNSLDPCIVLSGHLQKNKERIQKLKQIEDSRYIFQNKLEEAFFQPDMAYGAYKDLPRRIASVKSLRDKASENSCYC